MQCPELFAPVGSGCVYNCSQHPGFTLTTENNQPRCVYSSDTTKFVTLAPVNGLPAGDIVPTLQELKQTNQIRYEQYQAELDRVSVKLKAVLDTVDKTVQINYAFKELQTAENTRDSNPEAYQQARNAYYSLVNGEDWMDDEIKRVLKSEVLPETSQYRSSYTSVLQQKDSQQRTLDIIQAVKDRVLSLKDDFQYTTTTFQKQIETLKSQLNIQRRSRTETPEAAPQQGVFSWLNAVLNLLIVVGLVYAGLTIWKKVKQTRGEAYTPTTTVS